MSDVNKRWNVLLQGIADRKNKLQMALLSLGQFQSAIDDVLAWLDRTEAVLEEAPHISGDPRLVEIELAKIRLIQNDITAHEANVDSVMEAGKQVISSEGGAEATVAREKLDKLNSKWDTVLAKTRDRQLYLEDSLREATSFSEELQDMLQRLSEIDAQMITSKPVGGLPETAKEQLEKFMVSDKIGVCGGGDNPADCLKGLPVHILHLGAVKCD